MSGEVETLGGEIADFRPARTRSAACTGTRRVERLSI